MFVTKSGININEFLERGYKLAKTSDCLYYCYKCFNNKYGKCCYIITLYKILETPLAPYYFNPEKDRCELDFSDCGESRRDNSFDLFISEILALLDKGLIERKVVLTKV